MEEKYGTELKATKAILQATESVRNKAQKEVEERKAEIEKLNAEIERLKRLNEDLEKDKLSAASDLQSATEGEQLFKSISLPAFKQAVKDFKENEEVVEAQSGLGPAEQDEVIKVFGKLESLSGLSFSRGSLETVYQNLTKASGKKDGFMPHDRFMTLFTQALKGADASLAATKRAEASEAEENKKKEADAKAAAKQAEIDERAKTDPKFAEKLRRQKANEQKESERVASRDKLREQKTKLDTMIANAVPVVSKARTRVSTAKGLLDDIKKNGGEMTDKDRAVEEITAELEKKLATYDSEVDALKTSLQTELRSVETTMERIFKGGKRGSFDEIESAIKAVAESEARLSKAIEDQIADDSERRTLWETFFAEQKKGVAAANAVLREAEFKSKIPDDKKIANVIKTLESTRFKYGPKQLEQQAQFDAIPDKSSPSAKQLREDIFKQRKQIDGLYLQEGKWGEIRSDILGFTYGFKLEITETPEQYAEKFREKLRTCEIPSLDEINKVVQLDKQIDDQLSQMKPEIREPTGEAELPKKKEAERKEIREAAISDEKELNKLLESPEFKTAIPDAETTLANAKKIIANESRITEEFKALNVPKEHEINKLYDAWLEPVMEVEKGVPYLVDTIAEAKKAVADAKADAKANVRKSSTFKERLFKGGQSSDVDKVQLFLTKFELESLRTLKYRTGVLNKRIETAIKANDALQTAITKAKKEAPNVEIRQSTIAAGPPRSTYASASPAKKKQKRFRLPGTSSVGTVSRGGSRKSTLNKRRGGKQNGRGTRRGKNRANRTHSNTR